MSCVINKYFKLFKKNNINNNVINDINNNINNNVTDDINNNENKIICPCNNKATGIVYIKKYYNHNFLVCSVCLKHILLHVLVDNYIEL